MPFMDAIRTCLSKYATFSGRAGRPEYWWFFLFAVLGGLVTGALDVLIFGTDTGPAPEDRATRIVQPLFQLAIFVPLLAAGWRRMHDTGRPGWLVLLPLGVSLVTVVLMLGGAFGIGMMQGAGHTLPGTVTLVPSLIWVVQLIVLLLLLWWLTRPSEPDANAYGPPPAPLSSAK